MGLGPALGSPELSDLIERALRRSAGISPPASSSLQEIASICGWRCSCSAGAQPDRTSAVAANTGVEQRVMPAA
jgi:hypothetical protein